MAFRLDLFIPELYMIAVLLALFAQSMTKSKNIRLDPSWVPAAGLVGVVLSIASLHVEGVMFYGAYAVDPVSQFFKAVVFTGFAIAALNARRQPTLSLKHHTDYNLFLAFSALGLLFLASSVELITIYVALEIAGFAVYAIIPMRAKSKAAAEAGVKYILFGAAATAISLYGLSFIIAAQHSSYLVDLAGADWSFATNPVAVAGLSLFLAGMFYKLALFPFHFWAPDVYEGASNETAAFTATLPKLGAIVLLVRFAALVSPELEIAMVFAALAAVSMTFGNLSALAQKDVKRILGYSGVAHAGYIMVGLVSGTKEGLAAALFYSLVYILMNLTCFWAICKISEDGRNVTLDDLRGLHRRSPAMAFVLAVSAFALVGLPPTAGFMGKLYLLTSAWDHGYNWLVIVAAVNTALAIYYYLNIVRHAYTADETTSAAPVTVSPHNIAFGMGLAAALLLLGALPGTVYEYAMQAGTSLLP